METDHSSPQKIPSIKELRELAKRPHQASGLILPVCDYLSYIFAKPFLFLPLTPNQITVLWIVIKLIAASFLISGDYGASLLALFIFQVASIIDGVDGIIARYRKHFSLNGIYLDYLGHYLCNSFLLFALAYGIFQHTQTSWPFVAAGIGIFSLLLSKALTINFMWYKPEQREKVEKIIYGEHLSIIHEQKLGEAKNWKQKALIYFFDLVRIDNPLNFMFWGLVVQQPLITLWGYAFLLFLEMARRVFSQYWRISQSERKEFENEKKEFEGRSTEEERKERKKEVSTIKI